MTMQADLVDALVDAGLKVYPLSVPGTGTYPNVVWQRISNAPVYSHAGVELERPRMQLSCHGTTYAQCVATAVTVKSTLDLNQTDFVLAYRENEMDAQEVESGIYRIVLEYFIWHV